MTNDETLGGMFTRRGNDQTAVELYINIYEHRIEINYKTPDNNGYLHIDVPWCRKTMERYLHPLVFEEMVERTLPVKTGYGGFNSRFHLEDIEDRLRYEKKKKSKIKKADSDEQ